jgi:hypothetical protein
MATRKHTAGKRTPVTPAKRDVGHTVSLSAEQEVDAFMAFNAIECGCSAIAQILEPHIGMTYPLTNEQGIEIRFTVLALAASVAKAQDRLINLVFPDTVEAAEASHG